MYSTICLLSGNNVLWLFVHFIGELLSVTGIVLNSNVVKLQPELALVATPRSHRKSYAADPIQRNRSLAVLHPAFGGQEKLRKRNPHILPVGTAPREQHIMIDIVPQDIVIAFGCQVYQIRAAISADSHDQRVVLLPVVERIPLERFLQDQLFLNSIYNTVSQKKISVRKAMVLNHNRMKLSKRSIKSPTF